MAVSGDLRFLVGEGSTTRPSFLPRTMVAGWCTRQPSASSEMQEGKEVQLACMLMSE